LGACSCGTTATKWPITTVLVLPWTNRGSSGLSNDAPTVKKPDSIRACSPVRVPVKRFAPPNGV
jgi:hypothetical protein